MAEGRAERLLRSVEGVAYWAAVAPALACLPAALGYRIACWRGDWDFRSRHRKRAELTRNLLQLLGDELRPDDAERLTRQWFRIASCEAIDAMRLRGRARALRRLVEIRGREHLDAALADGKGAILCSAHFGSFDCAFSLLGASGLPVTTIGRWQHNYTVGLSSAERRFWDVVYARRMRRHRHRPNIEPWAGRVGVAAQAAAVLRANEVLTIAIDAPPLRSDMARTVEVPFLGRRARLLPGAVTLARLTGAPRAHVLHVPRGRLRPPSAGDLRAGGVVCERRRGDGIRSLRRRGECRHPAQPRPLGLLGEQGRPRVPRADPGGRGRGTASRRAGHSHR